MKESFGEISPKPKVLKSGLIFLWIVLGAAIFSIIASDFFVSDFGHAAFLYILYISSFLSVALIAAIVLTFFRWRHFKQSRLPKIVWVIVFLIVGLFASYLISVVIDNVAVLSDKARLERMPTFDSLKP